MPVRAGALLGGAAGLVLAVALVLVGGTGRGQADHTPAGRGSPPPLLDVAHTPPLLTVPGEPVELRYDIYCPPPTGARSDACDAAGTVFVRAGASGPFAAQELALDRRAAEGRYVARVPAAIAGAAAGFSYYAVLRDRATGASLTHPSGGVAAPLRSLPLGDAVAIDLGQHVFGRARGTTQRVLGAVWGDGDGAAGLEGGPETQPIGPSSFDVAADGTVVLLDQVHRRALRVRPGGGRQVVPLAVNGTIADLAVEDDGRLWVLETAGVSAPLLRGFTPAGAPAATVPLVDRTASQVRVAAGGPVVKQYPSEQWLPAASPSGSPLGAAVQRAGGRVAQPSEGGSGVVVLRTGDELRLALTTAAGVTSSWRVTSRTPLAEVQLAAPVGDGVLAVVRVFAGGRDEFVVLRLGPEGLRERFSIDSADWAETAPLSRFRLRGSSLYQLGSTPAGVHVDRFDLEVTS